MKTVNRRTCTDRRGTRRLWPSSPSSDQSGDTAGNLPLTNTPPATGGQRFDRGPGETGLWAGCPSSVSLSPVNIRATYRPLNIYLPSRDLGIPLFEVVYGLKLGVTTARWCKGASSTRYDARWRRPWADVELLVNPNGPLINGGSDGDNGQTGRKLVMDFYGPRVPIGGGALSGKDFSHIDRAGAYAARHAALKAVVSGAKSCQVTLAYAPNCHLPMDVCYTMEGRGERLALEDFHHTRIRSLTKGFYGSGRLGSGCHFVAPELPWNRTTAGCGTARKR